MGIRGGSLLTIGINGAESIRGGQSREKDKREVRPRRRDSGAVENVLCNEFEQRMRSSEIKETVWFTLGDSCEQRSIRRERLLPSSGPNQISLATDVLHRLRRFTELQKQLTQAATDHSLLSGRVSRASLIQLAAAPRALHFSSGIALPGFSLRSHQIRKQPAFIQTQRRGSLSIGSSVSISSPAMAPRSLNFCAVTRRALPATHALVVGIERAMKPLPISSK